MKWINIHSDQPDYPVGSNIGKAKKLIGHYLTVFYKLYSFDKKINLWCRGSSGAIMATLFAANCKNECKICHVKKQGEDSHSYGYSRYENDGAINIVIDDFIATGDTIRAIVAAIEDYAYKRGTTIKLDILMVMCLALMKDDITKQKFSYLIGSDY